MVGTITVYGISRLLNVFTVQLESFRPKNSRFSRLRQRRTQDSAKDGGTTEGVGAKQAKGVDFHINKTLILAHFFNEKGHAVSAVTRDNTKIFSQLTVRLKAEVWPK